MFTLLFWKALFERGVKTGAQAVVLAITGDVAFNAFQADFLSLSGVFLGGFILSALTSLASAGLTNGNPSLNDAEVLETNGRHEAV